MIYNVSKLPITLGIVGSKITSSSSGGCASSGAANEDLLILLSSSLGDAIGVDTFFEDSPLGPG